MIGNSYHFNLSNASWDLFKEFCAIVIAFSCIVTGNVAIGTLPAVIGIGDLLKTILSNLYKIDNTEREIFKIILSYYLQNGCYPTKSIIAHFSKASLNNQDYSKIKSAIEKLLNTKVLEFKDKEDKTIGPVF